MRNPDLGLEKENEARRERERWISIVCIYSSIADVFGMCQLFNSGWGELLDAKAHINAHTQAHSAITSVTTLIQVSAPSVRLRLHTTSRLLSYQSAQYDHKADLSSYTLPL